MSTEENIVKLFRQEVTNKVDEYLVEFVHLISRRYDIPQKSLLQDVATFTHSKNFEKATLRCHGILRNGLKCNCPGTHQ